MKLFNCFVKTVCILAAIVTFSNPAHAWWFSLNKTKGFDIKINQPDAEKYEPGQSATITGDIKLKKFGFSNPRFKIPQGIRNQLEIRYFFPSPLHEVTDQVTIINDQQLEFEFTTGSLSESDNNQFIVRITKKDSPYVQWLLRIREKFEARIAYFQDWLSNHPDISDKKRQRLEHYIAIFQKIVDRIDQKISNELQVLTERAIALQVGNSPASPQFYKSLIGGFFFELDSNIGTAIQGQTATIKGKVTNKRNFTHKGIPDAFKPKWRAKFFWQGNLLEDTDYIKLQPGESFDFSFETDALNSDPSNFFKVGLFKKFLFFKKEVAHVEMFQPVATDSEAPVWEVLSPEEDTLAYFQSMPNIDATIADSFGRVDPATISVLLDGTLSDSTPVSMELASLLSVTTSDDSISYKVEGTPSNVMQGNYMLTFNGDDIAGNSAQAVVKQFVLDNTPPEVIVGISDNLLTSNEVLVLPITVSDNLSPTTTTVTVNGVVVATETTSVISANVALQPGINTISVLSVDAANNISNAVNFNNIVLDNQPAVLSNFVPADGALVNSLSFSVSGSSNEELQEATLNGAQLVLSSDKKNFSGIFTATIEGPVVLNYEAKDLAGNISQSTVNIEIRVKLLNAELVSVLPEGDSLVIRGAPGATRAGVELDADGGFFNSGQAVAAADGSFSIALNPFTEAELTAIDPVSGQSETITLEFGAATTLSGVIKDHEQKPLMGATVRISGSDDSVVTDSAGVFMFDDPPTGDQVLIVDGTTIPESVSGPDKDFKRVNISITVGVNQSNLIERPIFLIPVMMDGSETLVSETQDTIVSSPHAPGVSIEIKAGTAVFPDGSMEGAISVMELPAEVSTIPAPEFAQPQRVWALEPSGLIFSEPAQLILPNVNDFEPDLEVVIMSLNSITGAWEIGGAAKVSGDGQSLVTKDGMGLLHHSVIYATPIGPIITEIDKKAKPGADTFNGSLSTSIQMPSYKTLGQDLAPKLLYKSAWAKPTTLVTNIFDYPKREITLTVGQQITTLQFPDMLPISVGGTTVPQVFTSVETTKLTGHMEIDHVDSQFTTTGLVTDKFRHEGVPNQSVISYSVDLKSPETGKFLTTGVYPYRASYEVQMKEVLVTTRTQFILGLDSNPNIPVIRQQRWEETRLLEEVFPRDASGLLYIQNKSDSPAGRGWMVAGAQKIANAQDGGDRVMIEEADGNIALYSIDNTIETMFNAQDTPEAGSLPNKRHYDLTNYGVGFVDWPFAYVQWRADASHVEYNRDPHNSRIVKVNLETGEIVNDNAGELYDYRGVKLWWTSPNQNSCAHVPYRWARKVQQMYEMPDGSIVGVAHRGTIFRVDNTGFTKVLTADVEGNFNNRITPASAVNAWYQSRWQIPFPGNFIAGRHCQDIGVGAVAGVDRRKEPVLGFADGGSNVAKFSLLKGSVIRGDKLIVADFGNHRVRQVDLQTFDVVTIAGNGQTHDELAANGRALDSSLFHPQGVAIDNVGNLYVSTERGYIRKIDLNGNITPFAGLPLDKGGVLADRESLLKMNFSSPHGLVIDNDNNLMYVADTGNHRIVRLDMLNNVAQVVGGTGSTGYNGDDIPALNATIANPNWLHLDPSNNLIVVDGGNNRIRRIKFAPVQTGEFVYRPSSRDNSKLTRFSDGTWERKTRDGVRSLFDVEGKQTFTIDRRGRQNEYQYDGQGRLVAIVDAMDRAMEFSYTGDFLTSIKDPADRVTGFAYDGSDLAEVIYPDGFRKQFDYDADGLLVQETNERGVVTQYAYNEWSRLEKVTKAVGTAVETSITINDSGSATASNNFTGGASGELKKFDKDQVYDGIVNPKSVETKFVKDGSGQIVSVVDGNGDVTTVERNILGQPVEIKRPNGTTVTSKYDPLTNDLIEYTDTALGGTKVIEYDEFGSIVREENARGFETLSSYDLSTGNLLSKTNSLNQTSQFSYDPVTGRQQSITDFKGVSISYAYDSSGNINTMTTQLGVLTRVRNAVGNVVSVTDPEGKVTQFEYDDWNRITAVVTPKLERVEYKYLPTGELTEVIDPYGNKIISEYDDLGRMVRRTDRLGNVVVRNYDDSGNLISETDANGNQFSFEYDSEDRLLRKVLPDDIFEYSYDIRGDLNHVENNQSEVNMNYDVGGRLVSVETIGKGGLSQLPSNNLSFTYDPNGNRLTRTDLGGQTTYTYDELDRLSSLTNQKGELLSFSFDDQNSKTTIFRPGSKTEFAANDSGLLDSITHSTTSGTGISFFNFEWDNVGNLKKVVTNNNLVKTFEYDQNDQLTEKNDPEGGDETFEYDKISNRIADTGGTYSYDSKNIRLDEDYKFLYAYDANGNLISKQAKGLSGIVINYFYSSENQLSGFREFEPNNSNPIKEVFYHYDALGRRVKKQVIDHSSLGDPKKTFTRKFLYDGEDIIFEYDGSNNLLAQYTHSAVSPDDVLAVDIRTAGVNAQLAQQEGSYFYLKDHLGSVTDVVDSSGNRLQRYVYSAFGVLLGIKDAQGAEISGNPKLNTSYTFTGRELDTESGLLYLRARYYDPNIGRFLQKDPEPGKLSLPVSVVNSYVYAGNNPYKRTDPTGESFWKKTFGKILIGIAVGFAAALTGGAAAAFVVGASLKGTLAGAIIGFAVGAVVGAVTGALVGGIVGGLYSAAIGGSFEQGFVAGAIQGAILGAIVGGVSGFMRGIKADTPLAGDAAKKDQNVSRSVVQKSKTSSSQIKSSGIAKSAQTTAPGPRPVPAKGLKPFPLEDGMFPRYDAPPFSTDRIKPLDLFCNLAFTIFGGDITGKGEDFVCGDSVVGRPD